MRAAARIKSWRSCRAYTPDCVFEGGYEMFGTCNSDVALVSSFKTKADLRTYIDHPEHRGGAVCQKRADRTQERRFRGIGRFER